MPYSHRGLMRLTGRQAVQSVERAAMYLLRLRELYDPTHPEYVEVIDALLTVLSELVDRLNEFRNLI